MLEDEFEGPDAWEEYLVRIETATPTVVALGITDYWSIDLYERVLAEKTEGRLPDVKLIFPNVEMRLGVATGSGSAVNAHLLISPDDPDHIDEARRFLSSLIFRAKGEAYSCTREDLIKLGRAHDKDAVEEQVALKVGTNQFKTTATELKRAFDDSEWAQKNIVVAVAATTGSGTSGMQGDTSMAATRQEIERLAGIIFSGTPSDRAFWLGEGADSLEELREKYNGAKPCLHGSDAHKLERVCAPDMDRFTWIKGGPSFEALHQALIEPAARVHIGAVPPDGALPYKVISAIELAGASWCTPVRIDLNPGLVGIIGARGSGKTALVDLVTTGAGSPEARENTESFIRRAADHLSELEIKVIWADGEETSVGVDGPEDGDTRVQYLSQQFVERLCSAEGALSDDLLSEIERVVFERHLSEERLGATDFEELLRTRAARSRAARDDSREALQRAVRESFEERRKDAELDGLRRRRAVDAKTIADDKKARGELTSKGADDRVRRLNEIQGELEKRQLDLDAAARRGQAVSRLADQVKNVRERTIPTELEELKRAHADAGVTSSDWDAFRRSFDGEPDQVLGNLREKAERQIADLRGEPVSTASAEDPFVADDADLTKVPRTPLAQEVERLQKQIGIDAKKAEQLKRLNRKISEAETALGRLDEQIKVAEGAAGRIDELRERRKTEYGKVFDALVEEENELEKLYAPLAASLAGGGGALEKLSFEVRREVDVEGWADAGEELLDLRKSGPFKGHGTLLDAAREELVPAWRAGSSDDVSEAMASFRDRHDNDLLAHSQVAKDDLKAYWEWAARVANWLDGTAHVRLRYGIQYDGVDIEQLSPGTRGIVLLLLYLSIDQSDDRPLIIDQPEENLDPKSVFDELVERFREARGRRQVIIVTHNANLVVNTDADQVIVASAGPHRSGDLPEIAYQGGGLEDLGIRREVCEILEGGQEAFIERAKRLRVPLRRDLQAG
ncbi:MAG TPA: AAA family ATPase [Solirubrobacterales bacterium]|nr:AAA family ATPase [Solirubrobacterales bacterium]